MTSPTRTVPSSAETVAENHCPADLMEIRRFLPWLVAVALFMENLDATIVNTAVPTISTSLGLAALGLWMVRRYMPDYRDPEAPRLDRTGFILFGAGVALLSYVLEVFGEHRLGNGAIVALLAISLALLAAYGWHGRHTATPVLE